MAEPAEERTRIGQFAVVNLSELIERLGYYGVIAVVALYLEASGYGAGTIGVLFAVLLPLPYIVPLLAGPLSTRFGYKPVMLAAFLAYGAGFLLLAVSPAFLVVLGGIVLVGIGAGLFKPLTAAAIGLLTAPRHRSLGYTLYYVGINIGGFVGPVLTALVKQEYRLAFLMGAGAVAANFVLVLLAFRNPIAPRRDAGFAASFRPMLEVLANVRFLALLAIFSGFWMLFSMNFSFVILHLQANVALPDWFQPSLQVSLESLLVIALGVPLGAIATRMPALRTMAVGIVLLVAGFATAGFATTFWVFALGIALVAAGEVIAYPGFLAYVTQIAPRDRVAVYQSFGFLPLFVGFLVGPLLGGFLYGTVAIDAGRPALFWALMCVLGLVALAALLLYARRGAAPASSADGLPAAQPRKRGSAVAPLLPVLAAFLLVGAGFAAGTRPAPDPPTPDGPEPIDPGMVLAVHRGTANEGQSEERRIPVPPGVGNLTLTLSWQDEAPAAPIPGATNAPDSFELRARDEAGTAEGHASGSDGKVAVTLRILAAPTNVTFTVRLASAGDTQAFGQNVAPDGSNAWTLEAVVAK